MRAVVNVSSGIYLPGQARLAQAVGIQAKMITWRDTLPLFSPPHELIPYAFKAWALKAAAEAHGATTLLWCDACMLPVKPLGPIFELIEQQGYFIMNNGWINGEWTADSAYSDLKVTREENWKIKHVVAGIFGVNLKSEVGCQILSEYFRLANTKAFCGPTWNANHPKYRRNRGAYPCGDETVRGHRHDQTSLSVIAWRFGCRLIDGPEIFAYRINDDAGNMVPPDPRTLVLADASYLL